MDIKMLTKELISNFKRDGFIVLPYKILSDTIIEQLHKEYVNLFNGNFETGIYPDEWHWRKNISLPLATKEICNGWKSNKYIASIVLSSYFGKLACELMDDWNGARIGQDDILWKPPNGGSEVGYHQDSTYISKNFIPEDNNSITIWCALDDANEENGCLEYARGSHKWNTMDNDNDKNNDSTSDMNFHCDSSSANNDNKTYQESVYKAASKASIKLSPLDIIKVNVPKGGCIIHHQDAWHGSGKNNSLYQPRRALVLHLLRSDVTFKNNDSFLSVNAITTTNIESSPSYIYGRYKRIGSVDVDESFFPITYSKNGYRTNFLEDYCDDSLLGPFLG